MPCLIMSVGVASPEPQTADTPPLRRLWSEYVAVLSPNALRAAFQCFVLLKSGWLGALVGDLINIFL